MYGSLSFGNVSNAVPFNVALANITSPLSDNLYGSEEVPLPVTLTSFCKYIAGLKPLVVDVVVSIIPLDVMFFIVVLSKPK